MIILGIETSCDETAAAVIHIDDAAHRAGQGEITGKILSDVVLSQIEAHRPFGGIVPEVAARAHLEYADRVVKQAMDEAGLTFDQLDGVAATGVGADRRGHCRRDDRQSHRIGAPYSVRCRQPS